MSYVAPVPPEKAEAEVRRIYEQVRASFGFLPNYYQTLGRSPQALAGHLALGDAVMKDGTLSRTLKEQIGLVVSGATSSSYCIAAHMEVLRSLGVPEDLSRTLATDYASAPLGEKEQVLFRLADKLTRHPDDLETGDIEEFRRAGWDEEALYETVLTVSWFNFVARFSIGLGLVADF